MKILYATMQFGPGYAQGTERYVSMLAGGMGGHGHSTAILAGDPEGYRPGRRLGEVVQEQPRVLHYPSTGWMAVQGLPPGQLDALLEREQPDLVHIANPAHIGIGLQEAARRRGLPVVFTVMDFWWLCPKHTLFDDRKTTCDADVAWGDCLRCLARSDSRGWLRAAASLPGAPRLILPPLYAGRWLLRGGSRAELLAWRDRRDLLGQALAAADAVIFPSRAAQIRVGPHVVPERSHSIPYGLEPRWFASRRSRSLDSPIAPPGLTVGFAGALAEHKGPHLLLEALRELGWNRTRVRLAGGGADVAYLAGLRAAATGLAAEFLGPVSSADMPAFLAGIDVLVVPSIWPENLPIVVLEALAAGVPVLASRVDGIGQVLPDGMLFAMGSAGDLAARLQAWAARPVNPPPQEPLLDDAEMVNRTLEVYRGVL
jgi:glycosyltransferase involved in cell wall biosynthesis